MSAADFLFTPALQRVLQAVYADTSKSFALNELLRIAASGKGSTQKQIDRLVKSGVLLEEPRRGAQRSLRANTEFFLYPELRSITVKSFGLAEPLREALAPFKDGIQQAFVFGSVGTGSDSHKSDIDLLVVGSVPLLDLSECLLSAEHMLGRPIHLNLYSASEWHSLRETDPVLSQISNSSKLEIIRDAQTDRI